MQIISSWCIDITMMYLWTKKARNVWTLIWIGIENGFVHLSMQHYLVKPHRVCTRKATQTTGLTLSPHHPRTQCKSLNGRIWQLTIPRNMSKSICKSLTENSSVRYRELAKTLTSQQKSSCKTWWRDQNSFSSILHHKTPSSFLLQEQYDLCNLQQHQLSQWIKHKKQGRGAQFPQQKHKISFK